MIDYRGSFQIHGVVLMSVDELAQNKDYTALAGLKEEINGILKTGGARMRELYNQEFAKLFPYQFQDEFDRMNCAFENLLQRLCADFGKKKYNLLCGIFDIYGVEQYGTNHNR
mgnify:CR=1 FL=1